MTKGRKVGDVNQIHAAAFRLAMQYKVTWANEVLLFPSRCMAGPETLWMEWPAKRLRMAERAPSRIP